MNTLLVLGTMDDPHVEWVVSTIEQRAEIPVVIIDYLRGSFFSVDMDSTGNVNLTVDGRQLALDSIVIWDCQRIMPGTSLYLKDNDEHSGYAAEEWRAFYRLLCAFGGNRTLNSLASRTCMVKPYQQLVASGAGFRVPKTLVTNHKEDALRLVSESTDGAIMKSLSSRRIRPPSEGEPVYQNIMTMRVSKQDIEEATQDEIACCPHLLQGEIVKDYELRVVYIDGTMLAFKIDSQAYKTSELDWRQGFGLVNFSPFELDDVLKNGIRRFMERMGLFSGSLDFIVDRGGRPWFLECNQQGAWGWLDECAGDNLITRAFVDALTKRVLGLSLDHSVSDVAHT